MPKTEIIADESKLEQLILVIAKKSEGDPTFGATKLNKLLFVIDLMSFGHFGKPVTGVEYVRREFGPAPRRLVPVRDRMVSNGLIHIEAWPFDRQRIVADREPDLSSFSEQERDFIEHVLFDFRRANASLLTEWSHGLRGWEAAPPDGTIPYQMVFLSDDPLTKDEAAEGIELALEHHWNVF